MHSLPQLPYAYNDLEPYIDAQTMEIHYTKHHQGYVDKLNAALEPYDELKELPVEALLADLTALPEAIRTAVRNNGGGHANHTLFWENMTPQATEPEGALAEAIMATFGSFDAFKEQFTQAALTRFGSGWAWLTFANGKLAIESTANQDTPLSEGRLPILGLDVWEHAYYLKYQNRRPEYIESFFKIINWPVVAQRYEDAQ